jgi:hypothetical protein
MTQRGLGPLVLAGQLCQEAERLYPGLFRAVSVRGETLHLEVCDSKLLAFKQIQGTLVDSLRGYANARQFPLVTRVKLTIITG